MQPPAGDRTASSNASSNGRFADRQWVRAAVERFERPLVSYAADLTGRLDVAREVVQETFVRLCSADRGSVEPRLSQWLFTVCRNLATDHRRKERRMSLLDHERTDAYASPAPAPGDAAEREDTVSAVLKCLASLPPVQQEAIRLKFQHGLSYKEIGAVMNLTVTNVGFVLHAGLKTIRSQLADQEPARVRS